MVNCYVGVSDGLRAGPQPRLHRGSGARRATTPPYAVATPAPRSPHGRIGLLPYSEQADPYGRLLRCRVAHLDGRVELHLAGELDLANADALRERVMWLAGLARGDVTLDLGALEFMGSVGVRCLVQLQEAMDAEQRRLVLRNVPPPVSRVIEVTEAEELLNIE